MTAFSRIVTPEGVSPQGLDIRLEAPQEALQGIARRLEVPSVSRLIGVFKITRLGKTLRVTGRLEAAMERICVASLEPFEESLAEAFEIVFSPDVAVAPPDGADDSALDDDAPEPLPPEGVDLAELLIQQAALAMAPHPRKPGARSLAEDYGEGGKISPFAGLAGAIAPNADEG